MIPNYKSKVNKVDRSSMKLSRDLEKSRKRGNSTNDKESIGNYPLLKMRRNQVSSSD